MPLWLFLFLCQCLSLMSTCLHSLVNLVPRRPQSQPRVPDEEHLFSICENIHPIVEHIRIITLGHCFQISILEANAFDFLFCQMAWTVADGEAAFRGTVDEMSSSTKILDQIRALLEECKDFGCLAISI